MSFQNILIVEDDAFKLERIEACLHRLPFPYAVSVCTSVQAAVSSLASHEFHLILLDMALPSHEARIGGAPPSSLLSGGIEVIMELAFLERSDRVIVLTQYPEIEIEGDLVPIAGAEAAFRRMYNSNVCAVIQYKHGESAWEDALLKAAT